MIQLRAGALEATVLPEIGMVVSSLRRGEEELLGQRGGVEAYMRGSTFAIPLLHPWANRLLGWEYEFAGRRVTIGRQPPVHLDPDTGWPIHGLLGASPHWQVESAAADRLEASLDFGAVEEYMRVFPFAHTLRFSAALGIAALTISLSVTNTDSVPVPIAFGFHPYLALPWADRAEWELTLPVAGGALDGALGDRGFDDAFPEVEGSAPEFAVAAGGRRLAIRFDSGYEVAQVYSPPGAQFIAFEPMTAPVDALRTGERLRSVEPGETFTAVFSVLVA